MGERKEARPRRRAPRLHSRANVRRAAAALLSASASAIPLPALADDWYYYNPSEFAAYWDSRAGGGPAWVDATGSMVRDFPTNGANAFLQQSRPNGQGISNLTILFNYVYSGAGLSNLTIDSNNAILQAYSPNILIVGQLEKIGNPGTASYTQTAGTHSVLGSLDLGYSSTGSGSYTLGGTGFLSVHDSEAIGTAGF